MQAKEQADGVLADLPPYALTYDPTVIPQLGKNLREDRPAITGGQRATTTRPGPG